MKKAEKKKQQNDGFKNEGGSIKKLCDMNDSKPCDFEKELVSLIQSRSVVSIDSAGRKEVNSTTAGHE